MQEFKIEKALEYYNREQNISEACRQYCQELDIEYSEKYRNRLSRYLRSGKVDADLENSTESVSNNYPNDKEKSQKGFGTCRITGIVTCFCIVFEVCIRRSRYAVGAHKSIVIIVADVQHCGVYKGNTR